MNFLCQFGSTVNHSHNILQIVAAEVVLAASVKGFQLGGQKIKRGNHADFIFADFKFLRVSESGRVPAVGEAENRRVSRRDGEKQVSAFPSANRCASRMRLVKAKIA